MTFEFKYRRVESPCNGGSEGIVNPESGCADAALEPCAGVPVRPGAGLGAKAAGAGDWWRSVDQHSDKSSRKAIAWSRIRIIEAALLLGLLAHPP